MHEVHLPVSIVNIKSNHKFLEVHEERKINLKLGLCKIRRKNHKDRRNLEFQFKIPLYQPLERALCFNFLKINIEDIVLRSSKLVHLERKNLACFTWNLMRSLMSLVLVFKSNKKWQKIDWT